MGAPRSGLGTSDGSAALVEQPARQPHPCGAAPRQILLFSGHRVDVPGRVPPRFPAPKVPAAAAALAAALQTLDAGPADLALTQGSAGGDLLFAEACLARGVPVHFLQPFAEARFLEESVRPSAEGGDWVRRYEALRPSLGRVDSVPEAWPERSSPSAGRDDPFVRCNEWLLDMALAWGPERLRFIALWDGLPGGGPGGTADMVEAVQRLGLGWVWLDARTL